MMLRERLEELGQGHLLDGLSAEQTTALLVQVDSSPWSAVRAIMMNAPPPCYERTQLIQFIRNVCHLLPRVSPTRLRVSGMPRPCGSVL